MDAELTKLQSAVKDLEGKVADSADATSKKLLTFLYVAIVLGVIELICLIMLLMR
jgi:hypothetical protein